MKQDTNVMVYTTHFNRCEESTSSPLHALKVYYVYYVDLEFNYNNPLWSNRSKISSM